MFLILLSTSAVSSYKLEKQNALEDVVPQKLDNDRKQICS